MNALSPLIPDFCRFDWLFHGESCPRLDVVHPGRAWPSSPACTWRCSLRYLFLQAAPLFPQNGAFYRHGYYGTLIGNPVLEVRFTGSGHTATESGREMLDHISLRRHRGDTYLLLKFRSSHPESVILAWADACEVHASSGYFIKSNRLFGMAAVHAGFTQLQ